MAKPATTNGTKTRVTISIPEIDTRPTEVPNRVAIFGGRRTRRYSTVEREALNNFSVDVDEFLESMGAEDDGLLLLNESKGGLSITGITLASAEDGLRLTVSLSPPDSPISEDTEVSESTNGQAS